MYIHPFLAGVVATLLVEMFVLIIIAIRIKQEVKHAKQREICQQNYRNCH